MRYSIYFVLSSLLLCGCGQSGDEATQTTLKPLVVAEAPPKQADKPAYRFGFQKPVKRVFRPGEPIDIEFMLVVPEGSRPPAWVNLQMIQGKSIVDSLNVEPKGDPDGGTYLFGASMTAPGRAGDYQLRVEAVETTLYTPADGEPESRTSYTYSKPIDIPVRGGE